MSGSEKLTVDVRALNTEKNHEAHSNPIWVIASAVRTYAVGNILLELVEHVRTNQRIK